MSDTIEIKGSQYQITGIADDGLPIIRGYASSTQDGFDAEGNPKVSVNIAVPSILIGVTPGEVQ